ncbi:MAG: KDO2-lipid IV(A) lauroyltransferase [Parvicellaceae bacterium]|jgi:KDO2-lipid IV(A) lauroyltransferase
MNLTFLTWSVLNLKQEFNLILPLVLIQVGSKILYYIFILPLSILPLWILHGISSFFYLLIYFVFGYRKKVVRGNLERSLPHLSSLELRKIERQFYQHFCDIIVESVKNFNVSKKMVKKRMVIQNPELIDKYYEEGRDVIVVGGHYNAWELSVVAVPLYHKHIGIGIYKPLSNKYFDKKMRSSREKFGLKMVPMNKAVRQFAQSSEGEYRAFIMGSDQSPSNPRTAYWTTFLNQETGVLLGAEKSAKAYDLPVINAHIEKVRRGYYTMKYNVLFEHPKDTKEGEITETHTKALEEIILQKPQFWLWSHRRWKHKRP